MCGCVCVSVCPLDHFFPSCNSWAEQSLWGALHLFFSRITLSPCPKPLLVNLSGGLNPGRIGESFFKISSKDSVGIIQGLWQRFDWEEKGVFWVRCKDTEICGGLAWNSGVHVRGPAGASGPASPVAPCPGRLGNRSAVEFPWLCGL